MTRTELDTFYYRAEDADKTYSDTIRRFYGPNATRWTISARQAAHPEINAALRAKLDADKEWLDTFARTRKEGLFAYETEAHKRRQR